jgi:CRISPR-associated protein Csx10
VGGGTCDAPLEQFPHFYLPLTSDRESIETSKLHRVITRSAIDDRLQTVEHGLLYSLEVLDPTKVSAWFRGPVICATPDDAAITRQELLQPIFEQQATRLHLGTARSRGLGEVETVGCQPYPQPFASVVGRTEAFNQLLRDWGLHDDRVYFSLTLHADAVIQDEYFRFHSTIPPALLAWEAEFSKEATEQLKLEACFTATRAVSGWNAALRVPKTDVTAIKMGAAFLYSAEKQHEQELIDKLTRLEFYGLGARRTEGFGRVIVCDPFHLDAGKEPI